MNNNKKKKRQRNHIKLPTSVRSSKKQGSSRKNIYFWFIDNANLLTVWIKINWGKFWKRWAYQTTWPASWEICIQIRKQQLELDMKKQTGSKLEKEYVKAYILSPCLFSLYAEYIMRNAGLDEVQAGIKIAGRNINNLRYADDTTVMAKGKRNSKASWWKWKRRVKKLT